MYPRNAASPERILIGQVVLIADGTVQSTGVSITVRGQGGAEAAGGGTIAFSASDNSVYYTPTQAETNFTSFTVIAYKASCLSASITVVTTASVTPGYAGIDWAKVTNPTTTVDLSATSINVVDVLTGHTVQTGDAYARLGAPVGASISADIAVVDGNVDDMRAGIIKGSAVTGTLSTTTMTTDLTGYDADQLVGRAVTFLSGTAEGEATIITAYAVTNGQVSFTGNKALKVAPSNTDTFKIT